MQSVASNNIIADKFTPIEERVKTFDPMPTAIVHSCDADSLQGAVDAANEGIIAPFFVAPKDRLMAAADQLEVDLSSYPIIDVEHSHEAAEKSVALAREGQVRSLMKGSLHTDEIMHEVARKDSGLRTERRISHAYIMDVPTYPKLLFIADAAINIFPDLAAKRDICQNTIDLARAMGVETPKVGILSAVETITPRIPSTLEAAALCKMADRGQITDGLLDGPLAFDNAISRKAAETKHIVSDVAGDVDILLAPDLEAGNMLAKQLIFLAMAHTAGIIMGARIPIILTSRADNAQTRRVSAALAALVDHARLSGQ